MKVLKPSSIHASRRSLKPTVIGNQLCPISCAVERFSANGTLPWPGASQRRRAGRRDEYPGSSSMNRSLPKETHSRGRRARDRPQLVSDDVGFNQRRDAWMHQGFNTFIDVYELDEFNQGEYAPKATAQRPRGATRSTRYCPSRGSDAPPILSRADTVVEKYRHSVTYFNRRSIWSFLREQILYRSGSTPPSSPSPPLGDQHPNPADFFRFMDSQTGEDLKRVAARLVRPQLAARSRGGRHQAVSGKNRLKPGRRDRRGAQQTGDAGQPCASPSPMAPAATSAAGRDLDPAGARPTFPSPAFRRW